MPIGWRFWRGKSHRAQKSSGTVTQSKSGYFYPLFLCFITMYCIIVGITIYFHPIKCIIVLIHYNNISIIAVLNKYYIIIK